MERSSNADARRMCCLCKSVLLDGGGVQVQSLLRDGEAEPSGGESPAGFVRNRLSADIETSFSGTLRITLTKSSVIDMYEGR